ncbi:MAG TPA: cytochrome P450 [Pseudonocardiaceae bacterium]|nr:cytochrome P450 [Pseudonocardiaceae bacterium]
MAFTASSYGRPIYLIFTQLGKYTSALRLDRGRVRHAAFGYGPHQCVGQNLARVELEIMLISLFTRFPELRLAVPAEELPFRTEMIVPGFHALPVTW